MSEIEIQTNNENSPKTLAVDLGNWNTKTNKRVVFESRYSGEKLQNRLNENIIEYNGNEYFMEKASWDKEFNKANKNYMPNLLYAIYRSFPNEDKLKLNIVLGLPLTQLALKEKLKEQLADKTFDFKFNGKEKTVSICKVGVVAEGFSSIFTIPDSERDDILLIDIGGRTINIIEYYDNRPQKKETLTYGIFEFYQAVLETQSALGKNLTIEDMRRVVSKGWINQEYITPCKEELVRRIKNDIKQNFKIDMFNIYFTGGGSAILRDELDKEFMLESGKSRVNFLPEPVFTNVLGNYTIVKTMWEKEACQEK